MADARRVRAPLAGAALLLFAASGLHALAFAGAANAIDRSALPPFLIGACKALWLLDPVSLSAIGLLYCLLAVRPDRASRGAILCTALVPLGAAALLQSFVGGFFGTYMMAGAALLACGAGWASTKH